MYIHRRYSFWTTFNWSKKGLITGAAFAFCITLLYEIFGHRWLMIPWEPISLIGIALSFYLGFKNNSSYERLWEARKIWGAIVNYSRSWGAMTIGFVNNLHSKNPLSDDEVKKIHSQLIYQHIAWITALRFQLRTFRPWEHKEELEKMKDNFGGFESPEAASDLNTELSALLPPAVIEKLNGKSNAATQLLLLQTRMLEDLRGKNLIDDFRHVELQQLIGKLYDEQGKSERIKNFPFPRQYATVTTFLIRVFAVLLPLSMMDKFDGLFPYSIWLTVPFCGIVVWVFSLMEMIGDFSENPFEGLYNDVPITTIARGIEIDLREMLDETDIPEPQPLIADSFQM
jgi:putative membrane protein